MTQQPTHITLDWNNFFWDPRGSKTIQLNFDHEIKYTEYLQLRQKIIQGLEYADNPNVPTGLKLIDELPNIKKIVNDLYQQIIFAKGGINTNDVPCNTKRSYQSLELAEKKYYEFQSLLDKAEGRTS